MKWFAANCIYQVFCGNGNHAPQFNEQLRLFQGNNKLEVLKRVEKHAESYNAPFKNCISENVSWKFLGVGSLIEIHKIEDGVEVSSNIFEPKLVDDYLKNIEHRKKLLTKTN